MRIAILGNGKMGKRISELAIERGHIISCKSSSKNPATNLDLSNSDIAIDFSTPTSAFNNISHALNSEIPVVSGTTAWLNKLEDITNLCKKKNGAFLYASNFSLSVNLFFVLNKQLAKLMKDHNYKTAIHEIHHSEKLDAPSGTAINIAKQMNEILEKETLITSERINNINGIHKVSYISDIDEIEIIHTAKNRDGFAIGAIIAAEWIIGKKGVFNIKDIFEQ
ncbi:MAG: 4-hydroxy-tetrahydrodipicolinate reductase [Flavobacteriales bacterium]|nr:4-hydroxy-tetrahydrodipicolinate reductase [Flavobacteriales bacterium]|tara:strand:+ start:38805 stop:39473 length:669 start_codon:yes stop_codon:yes gene_type:complete